MIENWMIILGATNLLFFLIGLLLFMPRQNYLKKIPELLQIFQRYLPYILIIVFVVLLQLLEVNILDPLTTKIVGTDFAPVIHSFEGDIVVGFSQYWTPILVVFFVAIYIVIYPFTLWFTPFSCIITKQTRPLKIFTYGVLLIYGFALPFYLFLPITNVYTFYALDSALNSTIPAIDQFFYATTTINNCFPSLHVAMALLVAQTAILTKHKTYMYFTIFCAIAVIIAVMYLAIHWITDVIGGMVLSISVFYVLKRLIKEK
ncbi:MAG: phosphatase PAP2 family protein [Euryarchaeota archaeon]|nr:phosphatase PAP2 family protein [Euryarchaeota archaeon]